MDSKVLCAEWVNSRGVIFRFTRNCLEIKVMDEQECIKSDVALSSFIISILRSEIQEISESGLKERLNDAMVNGTKNLKSELRELMKKARENANDEEKKYLKIVEDRIENGSLGERIMEKMREFSKEEILDVCEKLSKCVEKNRVFK
ncbi:MAG: glutamate-cysteine ligase family protein, partial [Archaeoglobaceae archaeon]